LAITEYQCFDKNSNIWDAFEEKIVGVVINLMFYVENYKKYLKNVFLNFANSGILRVEGRTFLDTLFDENNKILSIED
jgi:hypothetical protein